MRPKTYATLLMSTAGGLFLGVAVTNLLMDPQGVFGTGVLQPARNVNTRFLSLVAYQQAPAQYEGLLLGSSRANVGIPIGDLSRRAGVRFANFAVSAGRLEDHVLVIDYVLRQKHRDGQKLRTVMLFLDIDRFGDPPLPVRDLMQPPALSGDDPVRFWWRNLTVIQWRTWRLEIQRAWRRMRGEESAERSSRSLEISWAAIWPALPVTAALAQTGAPPNTAAPHRDPITTTRHFTNQLKLLAKIIALCRENAVELVLVIPPISRSDMARVDESELDRAIERVSRMAPVWDFGQENWLWQHPELWQDQSHFLPSVGAKLLAKIFGEPLDAPWKDFGRLRLPPAQQSSLDARWR